MNGCTNKNMANMIKKGTIKLLLLVIIFKILKYLVMLKIKGDNSSPLYMICGYAYLQENNQLKSIKLINRLKINQLNAYLFFILCNRENVCKILSVKTAS